MSLGDDPGLAFHEWSTEGSPHNDKQWTTGTPFAPRRGRNLGRKGPRSLVEIAAKTVADYISETSVTTLAEVPLDLLRLIWGHLESRGQSFHAWRAVSSAFLGSEADSARPTVPLDLYRFRQQIPVPASELDVYIQSLRSDSFDFIVHLNISNVGTFYNTELLRLTDLKNLGVLEISGTTSNDISDGSSIQITDRLLRGWAETPDAFPVLRVLKISGTHLLTEYSLQYACSLPSLFLFDVTVDRGIWKEATKVAAKVGWKRCPGLGTDHVTANEIIRHLYNTADGFSGDASVEGEACFAMLFSEADNLELSALRSTRSSGKGADTEPIQPMSSLQTLPEQQSNLTHLDQDEPPPFQAMPQRERRNARTYFPDTWGWVYFSLVGQLQSNEDLLAQKVTGMRAVTDSRYSHVRHSPKPFACIQLGCNTPSGSHPSGTKRREHLVFSRPTPSKKRPTIIVDPAIMDPCSKRKRGQTNAMAVKPKKRRSLADLFSSM